LRTISMSIPRDDSDRSKKALRNRPGCTYNAASFITAANPNKTSPDCSVIVYQTPPANSIMQPNAANLPQRLPKGANDCPAREENVPPLFLHHPSPGCCSNHAKHELLPIGRHNSLNSIQLVTFSRLNALRTHPFSSQGSRLLLNFLQRGAGSSSLLRKEKSFVVQRQT